MPMYKNHPTQKETPNRKTRKGQRNTVFIYNKLAARKRRAERAEIRERQALARLDESQIPPEESF